MFFSTALSPLNELVYSDEKFEVWKDELSNHHSLFSSVYFQPGDIVCDFGASAILTTPSFLTVQVNFNEHIYLQPSFLQYTNHSCLPNIFFDLANLKVMCLQPIDKGDELRYFYPSTEWEMAQPFQCTCGSADCLDYVGGASYLSEDLLKRYRFSDFIAELLNKKYSK